METKSQLWNLACNRFRRAQSLGSCASSKGQALVEFTLVFILLLIVAWIPADFGLAMFSGQLAQNAVREGTRIAAADPDLPAAIAAVPGGTCTIPGCYTAGNVFNETAARLPAAMLGASTINVVYPVPVSEDPNSTGCNLRVKVSVSGQYPFFFYKILRFIGINVSIPLIQRSTNMRWEHQTGC